MSTVHASATNTLSNKGFLQERKDKFCLTTSGFDAAYKRIDTALKNYQEKETSIMVG